ncbi:MAG: PadR family transcriptional regulator [Thermoplasmatota archaeon]
MDRKQEFRKKFNRELKTGLLGMVLLDVINRSPEPLYGYRIIKEIEKLSDGRFVLPEGTVYPILNSLETRGLLMSEWGKGSEGPRRKYYSMTPTGRELLSEILSDWRNVSRTIETMVGKEEVVK